MEIEEVNSHVNKFKMDVVEGELGFVFVCDRKMVKYERGRKPLIVSIVLRIYKTRGSISNPR